MLNIALKGPTCINDTIGGAIFSKDDEYRYLLSRDWNEEGPILVWIMLNPSIGNDQILEPTTAGCLKRAKMWGFGGMIVINLFGLVSTDPGKLKQVEDPVGPLNDYFITATRSLPEDSLFIAAWGSHGKLNGRDRQVAGLLKDRDLYSLGINKDGSPRHPLHMSHSIRPELWCGAGDYLLWS